METADKEIVDDLERLVDLKSQRNALDHEIEFLEEQLSKAIDDPVFYERDGQQYKATVVRGETFTVNAEELLRVAPELYEHVTKKVIDNAAFKRVVTNGDIDAQIANSIITIKEKKPYLRVGQIKDSDD
jgi:hypothetical protein